MSPLASVSSLHSTEDAEDVTLWDTATGADAWDEWPFALDRFNGHRPLPVLLASEREHMPRSDYRSRFFSSTPDATTRQDSINWILKASSLMNKTNLKNDKKKQIFKCFLLPKIPTNNTSAHSFCVSQVIEFYRFRPVTAYLSVNYLDRFLSINTLPSVAKGQDERKESTNGWPMQLLSVACLSIAAKMEETNVPLLLDLQILDPKYVFEPKTIRRMELFVMAALRWRMHAVTPFDFFLHLGATIFLRVDEAESHVLFSRAADLIIRTHRVVDFLGYRPSVVSAAAVLCAASDHADSAAIVVADCLTWLYEYVSQDEVGSCVQLMEEYLVDTCPSSCCPRKTKHPTEPPRPQSPVGVLDAVSCGSCDTHDSSAAFVINADQPPVKRRRVEERQCTNGNTQKR